MSANHPTGSCYTCGKRLSQFPCYILRDGEELCEPCADLVTFRWQPDFCESPSLPPDPTPQITVRWTVQCRNCRYWSSPFLGRPEYGLCKLHAPVAIQVSWGCMTSWPNTRGDDGCGDGKDNMSRFKGWIPASALEKRAQEAKP